ncbi:MAG: tyrosine-type recombinase/integrase, partial [Deltaproteobacteria bacterium]|nr:tyrosine-type recombinase/integrase [Deltaproteobacteria bacterium]
RPWTDIRTSWKRACDQAGFAGLLIHDLRRSAARNASRAGIPQTVIMALMGMRTASIFHRYRIVSGSDRAEAVEKLGTFLSEQTDSKVRRMIPAFEPHLRRK